MKSAVITGADGFLGSHFTRKCAGNDTEVWAVVHPESPNAGRISGVPGVHVVVSDIPGLSSKRDLFPESTDAFYHFAWQGVNADDRDNFDVQTGNIGMALDAVRFAGSLSAKKFITPGSTNEYLYYGKPIDQNAVPSPSNAYGSVKVAVRFLAQSLAEKLGISRTAYNKYENGAIRPVRKLKELADLFGVSADYILGGADDEQSDVPAMHRQMKKYMELSDNGRKIVDLTLDAVYAHEERRDSLPKCD